MHGSVFVEFVGVCLIYLLICIGGKHKNGIQTINIKFKKKCSKLITLEL
jgi:hypothetical protein